MSAYAQSVPGGVGRREQYSLAKILGIWALAAAPMGILSWIVIPLWHPISGRIPSDQVSRG
jgi:hypothetical protein